MAGSRLFFIPSHAFQSLFLYIKTYYPSLLSTVILLVHVFAACYMYLGAAITIRLSRLSALSHQADITALTAVHQHLFEST
jgi:hypothetical protein